MAMMFGNLEESGLGKRDAFHAPAVLVRGEGLRAGDRVRFTDDTLTTVTLAGLGAAHAVVDPFVGPIRTGQLVWVLLAPGLVGCLTHYFDVSLDTSGVVVLPASVKPAGAIIIEAAEDEQDDDGWDDGCSPRCG